MNISNQQVLKNHTLSQFLIKSDNYLLYSFGIQSGQIFQDR